MPRSQPARPAPGQRAEPARRIQPHDRVFRAIFSQPRHMADLLRNLLPAGLVAALDFATLTIEDSSLIGDSLDEQRPDLIVRVQFAGQEAFIYVLVEHQSRSHSAMPHRVVRYAVNLWNGYLQANPRRRAVPPVIPVVVHHGLGGPWRAPTRLSEQLTISAEQHALLARYGVEAELLLDDLGTQSEAMLRQRGLCPTVTLTLWMLANMRTSRNPVAALRGVADLVALVAREPRGADTLALLMRYILEVRKLDPARVIEAMAMKASNRIRKKLETTADILREEGRKEGLKQGLEKGREQGLEKGLEQGLEKGLEQGLQQLLVIQLRDRFGSLPAAVTRRVRQADRPALERWGRRILSAHTLDEVFATDEAPASARSRSPRARRRTVRSPRARGSSMAE